MEPLQLIVQGTLFAKLGWTLFHFVWQAGAVALTLALVLKFLHKSGAALRYAATGGALGLLVLLPVLTLGTINDPTPPATPPGPLSMSPSLSQSMEEVVFSPPGAVATPTPMAGASRTTWKDRIVAFVEPALPTMVTMWLVGVCGLSLWHLGGWAQLQRLRRRMIEPVPPALAARCQEFAERLGIRKTVSLFESALVQVPAVVGHFSPVILLPASALTGLSTDQIEAILVHELAHIKRCDYLVNLLQTLVEILGFYHPAVWWVSRQMRIERENCCDDIAVRSCRNTVSYAKALTAMEEIRTGRLGLAVAASGGSLLTRIRRLIAQDAEHEEKRSWLPSAVVLVLLAAIAIPAVLAFARNQETGSHAETERLRVYRVDRKVSDFPAGEDFNTPESAYAAINRVMAQDDPEGWLRVSPKRAAARLGTSSGDREKPVDPAWARTVLNANILEVRIKGDRAVVIAEFPQPADKSSPPIREPIDSRYLVLEEGKWLNKGHDGFDRASEARRKFKRQIQSRQEQARAHQRILNESEILSGLAETLFDALRKVDYESTLSNYDEQTGRWRRDGWKNLGLGYMVQTDWPSFALWICRTFKDNPIESVMLGEVFISDKEITDDTKAPAIPYKLILKDGSVLAGDLYFHFQVRNWTWQAAIGIDKRGKWQAAIGIDWHLQEAPLQRPLPPSLAPAPAGNQVKISTYVCRVPAGWPQLAEVLPGEQSGTPMITPEKLSHYLAEIETAPDAECVSQAKVLCLNHQPASLSQSVKEQSTLQNFKLTPHVSADRKMIRLEYSFEQSHEKNGIISISSLSSIVTLRPGHALAAGGLLVENQTTLIIFLQVELGGTRPTDFEKPSRRIENNSPDDAVIVTTSDASNDAIARQIFTKDAHTTPSKKLEVRIYDISDIMSLREELAKKMDSFAQTPGQTNHNLAQLFKLMIAPHSWLKQGGEGTLTSIGNTRFAVLQTQEIHTLIHASLDIVRQSQKCGIGIQRPESPVHPEKLETRIYDISDIFLLHEELAKKTGLSTRTPDQKSQNLSQQIKMTIAPFSWDKQGGNGTLIPYKNTRFAVQQTKEVHAFIQAYLDIVRQSHRHGSELPALEMPASKASLPPKTGKK